MSDRLLSNDRDVFDAVLDHAVFDTMYSLVKCVPRSCCARSCKRASCPLRTNRHNTDCCRAWTLLTPSQMTRLLEVISSAVQDILAALAAPLPSGMHFADSRDAKRYTGKQRSAFKALTYMFAVAVQVAEKTSVPALAFGASAASSRRGGRGGGKKIAAPSQRKGRTAAAVAADDGDEDGDAAAEGGEADGGGGEAGASGLDWPSLREACVLLLVQVLCADFRRLWSLGVPEEDYVSVFAKTGEERCTVCGGWAARVVAGRCEVLGLRGCLLCGVHQRVLYAFSSSAAAMRMLQSGASMKDKLTRPAVVTLLSLSVARFPSLMQTVTAGLVAAVTTHEHAAAVVADVLESWEIGAIVSVAGVGADGAAPPGVSTQCPAAAAEVLRELARINANDSRDGAGLRRAGAFVVDVSERLPRLALANVAVLLPFLDADAQPLRSAVVTAIARILRTVPGASPTTTTDGTLGGDADALRPTQSHGMGDASRDALLDVLMARAYDVHSLTRAAVLKAWLALVEGAAVPPERLRSVAVLAADRLRDKGALVRRAALALAKGLLEYNPFGGRADGAWFAGQVAAAEAWLEENAPSIIAALRRDEGAASGGAAKPKKGLKAAPEGDAAAAAASSQPKPRAGLRTVVEADDEAEDNDDDDESVAERRQQGNEDGPTEAGVMRDAEAAVAAEAAGLSAPAEAAQRDVLVTPEQAAYVRHRRLCMAGAAFSAALAQAVPPAAALLTSKTGSDVTGAIRFLARARGFGVPGAEAGLARMLSLVWAGGGGVRDEVVDTFDKLYILDEAVGSDDDDDEAAAAAAADEDGAAAGEAKAAATATGGDDDGAAIAADAAEAPTKGSGSSRAARKKAPAASAAAGGRRGGAAAARGRGRKAAAAAASEDDESEESIPDNDEDDDEDVGDAEGSGKRRAAKAATGRARAKPRTAVAAEAASEPVARKAGKSKASAADVAAVARRRAALDPAAVARNLIGLVLGAGSDARTSLEEVLHEAVKRELLPLATLVPALWAIVGTGASALQRARIQIALALSAAAKERAAAPGGAASARVGTALSHLAATRAAASAALTEARAAMSVLAMLAGAAPHSIDDAAGRDRLRKLLQPMRVPGLPVGAAFLSAAVAAVGRDALSAAAVAAELAPQAAAGTDAAVAAGLAIVDFGVASGDYRVARHACATLARIAGTSTAATQAAPAAAAVAPAPRAAARSRGAAAAAAAPPAAVPAEGDRAADIAALAAGAAAMVRGDWDGGNVECGYWYAAAQAALDAIFACVPRPELISAHIVAAMASAAIGSDASATGEATPPSQLSRPALARLFFAVSHVALKLLVHTESLAARVKALRLRVAEAASGPAGAAVAPTAAAAAAATAAEAPAKAGKGAKAKAAPAAAAGGIEEQLGVSGAEEEREAALVTRITEVELAAAGLGGLVAPLIVAVVTQTLSAPTHDASSTSDDDSPAAVLSQSALLALAKLMAISPAVCEARLPLLFTVLSRARAPRLRATIAVALGDLAFRFPNLTEPYTGYLYGALRDADARVRKNTLMVLSHLILNDMVKIKGQVGAIAVCLNDPEPRVADLTRLVS